MARSSRMAGGCDRPTEGKRLSSHAKLRTPNSSCACVDQRHVHELPARPTARAASIVRLQAGWSPAPRPRGHDDARPRPMLATAVLPG